MSTIIIVIVAGIMSRHYYIIYLYAMRDDKNAKKDLANGVNQQGRVYGMEGIPATNL